MRIRKESDKYYTPENSEIFIGQRVEYRIESKGINWHPAVLGPGNIVTLFQDNTIDVRIKYLDQLDFEELGWSKVELDKMITTGGIPKVYTKIAKHNRHYKLIHGGATQPRTHITLFRTHIDPDVKRLLFKGRINNFKELEKLTNQLGIR